MTTEDIEILLEGLLTDEIRESECKEVRDVSTFDEQGVLTRDNGLVITAADGSEYQITIVKSSPAWTVEEAERQHDKDEAKVK